MNSHLTAKQLAELLNVSERHIYRMNASGKLPRPKRIGRCVRWDPDEVRRMLGGDGPAGQSTNRR
jgi:excisionase family DNA binding protein